MSTTTPGAPPTTPPTAPPQTTFAPDNGDGTPRVTRNVPPKRAIVTPGSQVSYGGKLYTEGDEILHGEGPVLDNLQSLGIVAIIDHEQTDAWNGKEGDQVRKEALAHLDQLHAAQGTERIHDHGFGKYEHADGADAEPSEHTLFRQQAASEQMARGITQAEHSAQRRGGKGE